MTDPFLVLKQGIKQQSFTMLGDGTVLCEYIVPQEGAISHSGMTMPLREALDFITKLLDDGWRR